MPSYEFLNKETKEIETHTMSISALDQFKADNPTLERHFSTPPAFSYSGAKDFTSKTDNTWKEVMSKIAEKHPASPLADQYGKRTIKETKTKQVLEKHRKRQKQK